MEPNEQNHNTQPTAPSTPANGSSPVQPNALTQSITSTPPVVGDSTQKPKPKISVAKILVIFICLVLPLLILAYRLIIAWYYTPEKAYERDKTKIVAASVEAEKSTRADMDLITQKLEESYQNSYSGNGLTTIAKEEPTDGKYDSLNGSSNILVKYDGETYSNGCYQYEYYAGTKFDRHPTGEKAYCAYSQKKAYYWFGSKEALTQLVDEAKTSAGKNIAIEESYRADITNDGMSIDTFGMSQWETDDANRFFNGEGGFSSRDANLKWSEVFKESGQVSLPELKGGQNNEVKNKNNGIKPPPYYALIISIQNEYKTLYERSF